MEIIYALPVWTTAWLLIIAITILGTVPNNKGGKK